MPAAAVEGSPEPGCGVPSAPSGRILEVMTSFRAGPRRQLPNSPFNTPEPTPAPAESYAVNDLITHDKYGLGTVISVEDGGALVIDFGSHKQHIKAPYSKLTRL